MFCYTKFDIHCSGGHRMMLVIFPRTIYSTLIFSCDNLVLQYSCIIPTKINGLRNSDSRLYRLFNMSVLLFSILLLINSWSNVLLNILTSLTLITNYFCYCGENSLQYYQLLEISNYLYCEIVGWTWFSRRNMIGNTLHVVHPMVDWIY